MIHWHQQDHFQRAVAGQLPALLMKMTFTLLMPEYPLAAFPRHHLLARPEQPKRLTLLSHLLNKAVQSRVVLIMRSIGA